MHSSASFCPGEGNMGRCTIWPTRRSRPQSPTGVDCEDDSRWCKSLIFSGQWTCLYPADMWICNFKKNTGVNIQINSLTVWLTIPGPPLLLLLWVWQRVRLSAAVIAVVFVVLTVLKNDSRDLQALISSNQTTQHNNVCCHTQHSTILLIQNLIQGQGRTCRCREINLHCQLSICQWRPPKWN